MFSSRVLPLPQNVLSGVASHQLSFRKDSLQDNRIMPSEKKTEVLVKSSNLQDQKALRLPSRGNKAHKDSEQGESFQPLRSDGSRISRRRAYTFSDVFQEPEAPRRSPHATTNTEAGEGDNQSGPIDSPSKVCVCQRDPKVPRPRNAFILFRQHHQENVKNSNPTFTNPEISKVIGTYWRNLSVETKAKWHKLAEVKAEHKNQHPDYVYQPRRGTRGSKSVSGSIDSGSGTCEKCGRGSISTQGINAPPGQEVAETEQEVPERGQEIPVRVQEAPVRVQATTMAGRPQWSPQVYSATTPRGNCSQFLPPPSASRFNVAVPYSSSPDGGIPLQAFSRLGSLASPIISPEAKRRRFDSLVPSHGSSSLGSVYGPASVIHADRRASMASLPRAEFLSRSAPAARAGSVSQASLTLAPIKAGSPTSPSSSVEAMIMSIPLVHKIHTLNKITSPLPMPESHSGSHISRGSIISVEGTDNEALMAVITHLRDYVQQNNEHRVRLFSVGAFAGLSDSFSVGDWLKVIQAWHNESMEIKKFVTSVPVCNPAPSTSNSVSPKTLVPQVLAAEKDKTETEEQSPANANTRMSYDTDPVAGKKRKLSECGEDSPKYSTSTTNPIPVAIIPRYQLSHTDIAASLVPISDGYSPVEHWKWMAATWRGIPAPDATIIVRPFAPDDAESTNNSAGADAETKAPDVEIRLADRGCVILRYEKGTKIADSALRRTVFEIGELLRTLEHKS